MNMTHQQEDNASFWPELPFDAWKDTCETLHLWTQVVGKVRLELTPSINHWWHVPLYITSRGLTTSLIPYHHRTFEVQFDFIDHNLLILVSDGRIKTMPLIPRSVSNFYQEFMASLRALDIEVTINTLPSEIVNAIPCDEDDVHNAYNAEYAHRFWRILLQTEQVMRKYRSHFIGKSSPIHFFWGSFDLALTFFSGRRAPERPGADAITKEAYSHEVISVGFWPGNAQYPIASFYAYAAPVPDGMATASIRPEKAFFSKEMGEFLLSYDDVRTATSPWLTLLEFFESTYNVSADLAHWDRNALE